MRTPAAHLTIQAAWVAFNRVYGVPSDAETAEANLKDRMRSGKYGIDAFESWWRARADWFSDEADLIGMRWMLKALLNTGVHGSRMQFRMLRDHPSEAQVQNWYMRYAMFDPTMGMLNPDEARDFFLQRMTKRFNLLLLAVDEGAR